MRLATCRICSFVFAAMYWESGASFKTIEIVEGANPLSRATSASVVLEKRLLADFCRVTIRYIDANRQASLSDSRYGITSQLADKPILRHKNTGTPSNLRHSGMDYDFRK